MTELRAESTTRVLRYDDSLKNSWNEFIAKAKNGHFLFNRSYMDYHSDRFTDCSLMFLRKGQVVATMPATLKEKTLITHGGLTFGGVVSDKNMGTPLMLDVFESMKRHLRAEGIKKVIYKAIPYIYHDIPADEDLYALYINNARLFRRDVSSTILMTEQVGFNKGRRWSVKLATKNDVEVTESESIREFMDIERSVLQTKYNLRPVHTGDEMELLAGRFPENIKLFAAKQNGNVLAGVIVYESRNVAHAQYMSANQEGKRIGALDLVVDFLLNDYYSCKKYFDFGISTEGEGRFLNEGLIKNKEGFGARAVAYDFYEMNVE